MRKKTSFATVAVSTALLFVAAVLPALSQSGSGTTAPVSAQAAQTPAVVPVQGMREAATGSGIRNAEPGQDRNEAGEDKHERHRVESKVRSRTDGAVRSAYRRDKGGLRGEERRGAPGAPGAADPDPARD